MAMTNQDDSKNQFKELGTPGLGISAMSGLIEKAYDTKLMWPQCFPDLNRIRRSDPEVSMVRGVFTPLTARLSVRAETPADVEHPTDDDKRAVDFYNSDLQNHDLAAALDTNVNHTPFLGFSYFALTAGLRKKDWQAPDESDWRSQFNDGLIGCRKLAFRDHSTFSRWELQQTTGEVRGMWQSDPPNEEVLLPSSQSVHFTHGDPNSPEGLATLEAIYRLERIKYGYEVVLGIGSEHAAGYLEVSKTSEGALTTEDKSNVRALARAVLTAQEGNYVLNPYGFTSDVKDIPFSAASALLETVRYYGLLKLAIFNMAWLAQNTISGQGSYASMDSSTDMWLLGFNTMQDSFVKQLDQQYGGWLFRVNDGAFPGMTKRPRLVVKHPDKNVALGDIGSFLQSIKDILPLGKDDMIAIRKRTQFLPESLPKDGTTIAQPGAAQVAQQPQDPAALSQLAQSIDRMTARYNEMSLRE